MKRRIKLNIAPSIEFNGGIIYRMLNEKINFIEDFKNKVIDFVDYVEESEILDSLSEEDQKRFADEESMKGLCQQIKNQIKNEQFKVVNIMEVEKDWYDVNIEIEIEV